MCDLGLSQRDWCVLRSYLPDTIPPLSRVKGWLHANEAPVVAEEVNGQRMAGVSLIDSVRCDLTVSARLRRSHHKIIKIGSDSASDTQEKDLKKKSITILVYCYVGEKVGHHDHVLEVLKILKATWTQESYEVLAAMIGAGVRTAMESLTRNGLDVGGVHFTFEFATLVTSRCSFCYMVAERRRRPIRACGAGFEAKTSCSRSRPESMNSIFRLSVCQP